MTYSTAELEAIGLCICVEAAGDIANHSLLSFREITAYPGEAEVLFQSAVHRDLFLVRLVDFVKEGGSKQLTGVAGSCLSVLREACSTKCFDSGESISDLKNAVEALDHWLSYRKRMTLWLPTLDINAEIEVSRLDFLKIIGNHSKHNLSRLTGVSKDVAQILSDHGYSVPQELIPLALDDFREHLAENYFAYYSTWLTELVNNLCWGVQTYLDPVFRQSYIVEPGGSGMYRYDYPAAITEDVPRQWFWRLMNHIRARPYMTKFAGSKHLKRESSLEWDV